MKIVGLIKPIFATTVKIKSIVLRLVMAMILFPPIVAFTNRLENAELVTQKKPSLEKQTNSLPDGYIEKANKCFHKTSQKKSKRILKF